MAITPSNLRATVQDIYRTESRRVLATLIRLLGDFELAEEALHDAFAAALEQWPRDGLPNNPRAWLVSAGRFKAIDQLRRKMRFDVSVAEIARQLDDENNTDNFNDEELEDDQLRLIFTCCHPSLGPDAQVALTLREVCGLTTEEIARAFLAAPSTIAQRIVRAKNKIRDAHIPYEVPAQSELSARIGAVLQVIYLVFNEGYSASAGDELVRTHLSAEAIRLARLLIALMPDAEAMGLLAMMLFHASRDSARAAENGDLILLNEQNRALWNREQINEGSMLIQRALTFRPIGAYVLQAAIAALHAESSAASDTDWAEIVGLYNLLLQIAPSPVIELNRAVAVAMRDGPDAGLELIDAILSRGDLADYHLAYSARADMCRRLGRTAEAKAAYARALELTQVAPERRFLERRLTEL